MFNKLLHCLEDFLENKSLSFIYSIIQSCILSTVVDMIKILAMQKWKQDYHFFLSFWGGIFEFELPLWLEEEYKERSDSNLWTDSLSHLIKGTIKKDSQYQRLWQEIGFMVKTQQTQGLIRKCRAKDENKVWKPS